MNLFIISVGYIFMIYYLRKKLSLSEEQFREYFTANWDKYLIGVSFEKKLKNFRMILKLLYWAVLIQFIALMIITLIDSW